MKMSVSTSGQQPSPSSAIDFMMLLQKLKTSKRTGWVLRGVDQPESIADHMYRMSMMTLIATDSGVNVNRCVKMALVHDLAESIVGDITPHCPYTKEEKHALEVKALADIVEMLGPETSAGQEVSELWHEYENAYSAEALLVKDFDKLEMIIQAFEYEQAQPGKQLQEFFDSTQGRFKTPTGQAWAEELVRRRNEAKVTNASSTSSPASQQK